MAVLLVVYLFGYHKDDKEQIGSVNTVSYAKVPIKYDDTQKFIPEYQNIFSAYPWYNKVTPLPWNNPTSLFTGYWPTYYM